MSDEDHDPRLDELLDVMLAIARQDFDVKARASSRNDAIDAIAVGLNMLVDELRDEVASRRELEHALDELKRTQAQLVHAGKLAAIGQLAAGVAHEINNPIQGIQVALTILQRTQRQQVQALENGTLDLAMARRQLAHTTQIIADAHEAIDRIRGVTSSLRTFARADDEELRSVQLDDVIRVSCRLSESSTRLRARLDLDVQPVQPIRGNRGKLGQVVTNLLVNALQAIPEGAPDEHTIRLTLRERSNAVSFVVEDSGPGVPNELRSRIFEPFFTTKPVDLGTGLGLALVAEIVRTHGGSISIGDSDLGGARFEVVFPTTSDLDAPTPADLPPLTRRPRVLIIDDEAMLLRLFRSVLSEDCDVITASSGASGVEILTHDQAFDLVVCDLHMPGLDGVAVYETLNEIAPSLTPRFVFATGGAVSHRGRSFLDHHRVRVLQKPFDVSALRALLSA